MKVTFPHMGNACITINALLKGLNLEVITPPPISKKTFELGVKYSPEFACLPLKLNVGNFIEALEKGADTIVMAGGWGPCRFGYYAQVERDILKDLGYEFEIVILEAPDHQVSELVQQLKSLGNNISLWKAINTIHFAWMKLQAVETLEKELEFCLPRVIDKSLLQKIYQTALQDTDAACSRKKIQQILHQAVLEMREIPQSRQQIIKIGLVGEIYTILEPSSNYHLIDYMGYLGVEVTRAIYLSDWINDHLLGGWIKKSHNRHIIRSSQPYINYFVGGHGQQTIGYTVDFARRHYHGVIQIAPLTCMPEIVAHSILPRVSEAENIPVMTMYFDEHAGEAGIQTRLEAFVDMLRRKNRRQDNSKEA